LVADRDKPIWSCTGLRDASFTESAIKKAGGSGTTTNEMLITHGWLEIAW